MRKKMKYGAMKCYVFLFSHKLTDVQPPQWQGSALEMHRSWVRTLALPFVFFSHFSASFLAFLAAWAWFLGPLVFSNSYLPSSLQHPWPNLLLFIFYFHFFHQMYFHKYYKNHKKYKYVKYCTFVYFILFLHKKYIFILLYTNYLS